MKILAALLIGAFSLLALEIGVRAAHVVDDSVYRPDLELGWGLTPFASGATKVGDERVNSLGWRGPEPGNPTHGTGIRIACLGDSVTFGVPIEKDQDTYPRQLEALLRGQYGLAGAEVFNFGIPGYGTFHGSVLMKKTVPDLRPRIVTLFYGWNDRTRIAGWFSHREQVKAMNSWWHRSALLRTLVWSSEHWMADLRRSRRMRSIFGPSWIKHGQTLEEVEANLLLILQRSREEGIAPLLLTSPFGGKGKRELLERYRSADARQKWALTPGPAYAVHHIEAYNALVREIAQRTGTRLVDLAHDFEQFPESELEGYFEGIMHLNARGCRIVAERLAPVIREIASQ